MADPFISSARQDFQDTKADLRAAYEAGDITRDQFREAKQEARDVFSGYKGDVRAGNVTDYSNPFASFSPTGIASLAPSPTVSTPYVGSTVNNVTTAVTPTSTLPTQTFYKPLEPEGFDFTGGRTAAPEFNLQTYADVLSKNKLNTLDKLVDIITGGGTLSKQQEGKLGKISGMVGENLATALGYYPTTERYEDKFTQFLTPKATDAVQAQTLGTTAGTTADTVAATTPTWAASPGDLYEALNYNQEERLSRLAGKYAAGELEGREGKIGKLTSLLDKAGLGTLESYFSPTKTYVNPTDLGVTLPENLTYQQLADYYYSSNELDPLRGYVYSGRANITPEQYLSIVSGYQPNYNLPVATQYGVENFLATGRSDAQDYALASEYLKNPDNPIFASNPSLVTRAQNVIYSVKNPITESISATATNKQGEEVAGTGQYGYVNGAPVLNTDIIDQMMGDVDRIGGKSFKKNQDIFDELGWNFQSKEGLNKIFRGTQIVGLDDRMYTPDRLASMDYVDPTTGEKSDARYQLEAAAQKIGLDPTQFKTASSLYQAIEQATDGLYQIVGQFGQWDPEKASTPEGKQNHASVLYKDFNGQLIPVGEPQFFKYTRPEEPIIGGEIGEIIGSVPFLPEILTLVTGQPELYPVFKGVQTASRSGDISDVVTSAGLAYLTSQVIPNEISPALSTGIAKLPLVGELANVSTDLANFVVKAGTNATISMGLAQLLGKDPMEAAVASLIASGVFTATKTGVDMTGIPDEYKPVVTRILASALTGKSGGMANAVTNFLRTELTKTSGATPSSGGQTSQKETEV